MDTKIAVFNSSKYEGDPIESFVFNNPTPMYLDVMFWLLGINVWMVFFIRRV